ncbi:hypothetical protein VSR01_10900 [Actinacidiphila sp. DG2A-62]|uniref:hypothetical protein n=1 Tax=Actinacidiphila sp. DG2A-62 TaxID=3108821 RepID=UPI002DB73327|nr:hypothetical protein [Actinacidiphila sp. DG2A-62]MEC3994027.1 hypothetical protein [Actinacidiphila sp. DG2A-62]
MAITNAQEWADALDAHQKEAGQSVGDIISFGYADGEILGVVLDPNHPDADDERAIVASAQGWVVRYNHSTGWWEAN